MASNTAPGLLPAPGLAHAPTAAARVEAPTVPAHMLPHRTPPQLLSIARQGLSEAAQTRPDGLRYAAGVYNLFNWQYALPALPYATNLMPQNGRSFIFSLTAAR